VRIGRRTSAIQRPHEGFAATQIHQALGSEIDGCAYDGSVLCPDTEAHNGRAVAEHGIPHLLVELREELVGE